MDELITKKLTSRFRAYGAGGSVEAARRGSMAAADQANACVSSSTTFLDPHERLGPAVATPGVGNLLKRRRPRTPV